LSSESIVLFCLEHILFMFVITYCKPSVFSMAFQ
jgi:hypothetical protein